MSSRRIRKAKVDSGMRTVGYSGRNHIQLRVADCLYIERISVQHKVTGDFSFHQIKGLVDVRDIRSLHSFAQFQTDNAQMQAVRVHAEPIGSPLLTTIFLELASIYLFMSATEIILFQILFPLVVVGIAEAMPPPLALRTQRHTFGIHFRKCLQPGSIYRKGKFTVAHGKRSQRIECRNPGIVTRYQCFTVNRSLLLRTASRQSNGKQGIKQFFHGI